MSCSLSFYHELWPSSTPEFAGVCKANAVKKEEIKASAIKMKPENKELIKALLDHAPSI